MCPACGIPLFVAATNMSLRITVRSTEQLGLLPTPQNSLGVIFCDNQHLFLEHSVSFVRCF